MQEFHRPCGVVVVGRFDHQIVELAIEAHEGDIVIGLGGALHAARDLHQLRSLLLGRALGPRAAQ